MTSYPTPSGAFGTPFDQPVSSRVSILAIVSLVLAILCFLPGAGVLAMLCGGLAILFISSGKGRLTGLGLAVAGCVIGLVATVLWGFALIGAASIGGEFANMLQPVKVTLTAMEKGDYTAARAELTPTAAPNITDAQITEFVARYQADIGAFKSVPDSTIGVFQAYMAVGPAMQNFGQRQNVVPVPAEFANGWAVVLIEMPSNYAGPPPGKPNMWLPIENIGILTPNGEHWLQPHAAGAGTATGGSGGAAGGPTSTPPTDGEPDPDQEPASPEPDPEPAPGA